MAEHLAELRNVAGGGVGGVEAIAALPTNITLALENHRPKSNHFVIIFIPVLFNSLPQRVELGTAECYSGVLTTWLEAFSPFVAFSLDICIVKSFKTLLINATRFPLPHHIYLSLFAVFFM